MCMIEPFYMSCHHVVFLVVCGTKKQFTNVSPFSSELISVWLLLLPRWMIVVFNIYFYLIMMNDMHMHQNHHQQSQSSSYFNLVIKVFLLGTSSMHIEWIADQYFFLCYFWFLRPRVIIVPFSFTFFSSNL